MWYCARSGARISLSRRPSCADPLEHQQGRDHAVVGEPVLAEVEVAGDLAAEDRVLVAHALLDEGVADAVDERRAARAAHVVGDGARGAHVVHDARARLAPRERLAEHRRDEVARHVLALVVDEEAAVGVAVPGDPQVGALRAHALDEVAAVLLERAGRPGGSGRCRRARSRGVSSAAAASRRSPGRRRLPCRWRCRARPSGAGSATRRRTTGSGARTPRSRPRWPARPAAAGSARRSGPRPATRGFP